MKEKVSKVAIIEKEDQGKDVDQSLNYREQRMIQAVEYEVEGQHRPFIVGDRYCQSDDIDEHVTARLLRP